MEIAFILAALLLGWMAWQLYRAKQFNQFKRYITDDLRPQVLTKLADQLNEGRSDRFPNNDAHIEASKLYWSAYPSRVLQAALAWQVLPEDWVENSGNKRHCQHLFFIEQDKLATFVEITLSENDQE